MHRNDRSIASIPIAVMSPLTGFAKGIELVRPGFHDERVQQLRESFLVDETRVFSHASSLDDDYLQDAAYLACMSPRGTCEALARIIHMGKNGFELKRYLDPADYVPVSSRTIEVSEVIIRRDARGSDLIYRLALGFGRYITQTKPDTIIGLATEQSIPLYERIGCRVFRGSPIKSYWGVTVYFCAAHPATIVPHNIVMQAPPLLRSALQTYFDTAMHFDGPAESGNRSHGDGP